MNKADLLSQAVGEERFEENFGKAVPTTLTSTTVGKKPLDGARVRVKGAVVIPVADLEPDPEQPRQHFDQAKLKSLAASLKAEGQQQPIRVLHGAQTGRFIVLMGERRYRAAKLAGLKTLDCIVEKKRLTQDEKLKIQFLENELRVALNPIENGQTFKALLDSKGCSMQELAKLLHIEASTISRSVKLLSLPVEIQQHVVDGSLPANPAYQLARLDDPDEQRRKLARYLAKEISATDISGPKSKSKGKKGSSSRVKKSTIDGVTISVCGKRGHTNLQLADALIAFAERLRADGRSQRAA